MSYIFIHIPNPSSSAILMILGETITAASLHKSASIWNTVRNRVRKLLGAINRKSWDKSNLFKKFREGEINCKAPRPGPLIICFYRGRIKFRGFYKIRTTVTEASLNFPEIVLQLYQNNVLLRIYLNFNYIYVSFEQCSAWILYKEVISLWHDNPVKFIMVRNWCFESKALSNRLNAEFIIRSTLCLSSQYLLKVQNSIYVI